jgi:hypothetical protein
MRRLLITLTVALGLLVGANPASAATPTTKTEDRAPGATFVHLQHGREMATALVAVGVDESCEDDADGASQVVAVASVFSTGHRVSAGPIALIRGASVVREFTRQQVATTEANTNTHPVVPTTEGSYRAKATIAVRWKDRSLSRYTIHTKYTASVPPCDT